VDAGPVGAPLSEKLRVCVGISLSVALAVNVSDVSSTTLAVAGTPLSTGAALTSVTFSAIAASVFVTPSLTRTVNG
jgi:hypothetical protein